MYNLLIQEGVSEAQADLAYGAVRKWAGWSWLTDKERAARKLAAIKAQEIRSFDEAILDN
jgi:hypothetical protein